MNDYIRLVNADDSLDKRFKVLMTDFDDAITRVQNAKAAINGTLVVQVGPMFKVITEILKVSYTPESGYGDIDDVETFYTYKPPKNLITYVDHFGTEHNGFLMGDFHKIPQVSVLDSSKSFWLVPIVFHKGVAL